MNRSLILSCAAAVALAAAGPAAGIGASGQAPAGERTLDIYIADTEGGKATLFVTPAGQSLLIDSGNPGERDLNRILEVLNVAGVKTLDYLLSTHYHVDHIGGMPELAERVPIAHYIDHGPSVEPKEQVQGFQAAYAELRKGARHTVVKPGDKVPLRGLDWTIVTAGGEVLKTPLPGGGAANPACRAAERKQDPANPDENAQSVGSVIAFGKFRAIDLGDLLWNKELELVCPTNPVGTVDLYLVTHHGLGNSGASALVHAVRPRVAVMQNGTRKGGAVTTYEILRRSPGLEDIWQLHWSYNAGIEHNPAGVFIANVDDNQTIANVLTAPPGAGRGGRGGPAGPGGPGAPGSQGGPPSGVGAGVAGAPGPGTPAGAPPASGAPGAAPGASQAPGSGPGALAPPGQGRAAGPGGGRGAMAAAAAHTPAHYIRISAREDGTFTVTNSRNGFSRTYVKR